MKKNLQPLPGSDPAPGRGPGGTAAGPAQTGRPRVQARQGRTDRAARNGGAAARWAGRGTILNDNNPELIKGPGILLSTFDGQQGYKGRPLGEPSAHLNTALSGPFELFSHHVYAGTPESLDSTLWLAVVAAPRGKAPVKLRVVAGSTALSQSVDADQPAAPFLPLPALMEQGTTPIYAGPGSRVAAELLAHQRSPLVPEGWTLPEGQLSTLMVLPLPVRGLDPLLNGRNLQLRLHSDGPVDVATLAAFGPVDRPPDPAIWKQLLEGGLSPKEHRPTPRGSQRPDDLLPGQRHPGGQRLAGTHHRSRPADPVGESGADRVADQYPGAGQPGHGPGADRPPAFPLSRHRLGGPRKLRRRVRPLPPPAQRHRPTGAARAGPGITDQGGSGAGRAALQHHPGPGGDVPGHGAGERTRRDRDRSAGGGGASTWCCGTGAGAGPGHGEPAPGQERTLRVRMIYPADATPPQVFSLLPVAPATAPGEL